LLAAEPVLALGTYRSHECELDPTRRTILHCTSGDRSALGAVALTTLRYQDVAHLDGGIKAWRNDNRAVVTSDA
jgi:rhodanese-related sulfurtransferase